MKNENTYTSIPSFCIRSTPFGPVALLWSVINDRSRISRVFLTKPGYSAYDHVSVLFPDSNIFSCSEIEVVANNIEAFLNGDDIRFSLELVFMDLCSKFQQDVLHAEHGIPRGFVSTYQRIAKHMGKPTGARAVGTAFASNPFPLIIPYHRAIRTDRTLGGYQGGLEMKRMLLEMEGIGFNDAGCIVKENLFY